MRTAVVVLGMHRSGTSALAGALAQAGCDLPVSLSSANRWNPRGEFESSTITKELDSLLHTAGSRWDDWLPISPVWSASEDRSAFVSRLAAAVVDEFGASGLFVLKDPRSCRLVDVWIDVLSAVGCEPVFIHIHRHPTEVAASLARRDAIPAELGQLIWLRHVLEAEAGSRGYPRAFTSYDGILNDWPAEIHRIQESTGLPHLPARPAVDMPPFLTNDLRHWVTTPTPESVSNSHWIGTTWGVLERWRIEGEQTADYPTLDGILREFNDSAPEYQALGLRLDRTIQTLKAQSAQLAELKSLLAGPTIHAAQPTTDGLAPA